MTTLGAPIAVDRLKPGSCWQLSSSVNGFANSHGHDLVTQAASGRGFQVIADWSLKDFADSKISRFQVCLLEDGYPCWLDWHEVFGNAFQRYEWLFNDLSRKEIETCIPFVLKWLETAACTDNEYLWGGTIGPHFDCSGLVQAAFASQGIWLPRDAYQQENFCEIVDLGNSDVSLLSPGDLLFFGTTSKCTHVGIHKGQGIYFHSSGKSHGRNGIGCDCLHLADTHPVACFYRSQYRGAGRVVRCYEGIASFNANRG